MGCLHRSQRTGYLGVCADEHADFIRVIVFGETLTNPTVSNGTELGPGIGVE